MEGFYWRFPWLSACSPPTCPLCLVFRRTVTVLIWLLLPYIFLLCRLMSSDGANAFVLCSLSCRPSFNCCFSYSCRQKVVFAASLPRVSVTGILPALCVSVSVWACLYVCVHVRLCVWECMCKYFSGVESTFMSVPSVENGSASEGQPLVLHWASHSVPKSQMPLSDVGSLLFVHETTTENILYLWDGPSDLLHTSMWTWT